MKEGMVNRGEGIPQRHNTIEVLMMCVDEQGNLCCYLLEEDEHVDPETSDILYMKICTQSEGCLRHLTTRNRTARNSS